MRVTLAISIHALREEGDLFAGVVVEPQNISIHALREEGDTRPPFSGTPGIFILFLSTPSARRATLHLFGCACRFAISIHALREEGDH